MRWALFILILVGLSALSRADSLTLPAAIQSAETHSPELKKKELLADAASWSRLEAIGGHLPQIKLQGTHFFDAKYSRLGVVFGGSAVEFPTGFPQTSLNLEVEWNLIDSFGTTNRFKAANLEHDAALLEWSHQRAALATDVTIKFQKALAAKELARVADQNIESLHQHLNLARANERAGYSTRVNVLRIESQLEEARAEKILAEDNVLIARHALNQAMGVEADDRELQGELPVPESGKVSPELKLDLSRREDIQAQVKREAALDRRNAAAAAFWGPRVSLFGVQQFYKFGDFDPAILPNSSFQNAYGFGVRLSWTLFDAVAIAHKAYADDTAQIASQTTRQEILTSPNDFDRWKRRYVYNSALYLARKRSVDKSTEGVRLATLSAKAGTNVHSEVLDAELELFRARAGVIQAQVEAAEALAQLELAIGRHL